jgi:Large polyvalent protein associated domain 23
MPIFSSDGQAYENEFDLTLGRPIQPKSDLSQQSSSESNPSQKAPQSPTEGRTEVKTGGGSSSTPELTDDEIQRRIDEGTQKGESLIANYGAAVIKGLATLPQRAIEASQQHLDTGEPYDVGPVTETSMAIAGLHAPFIKPGTLGVFGGSMAKGADIAKQVDAHIAEAAGMSAERIWKDTGWYRGTDGSWKFEIPDTNAKINPTEDIRSMHERTQGDLRLSDILDHPDLYHAYPDLADIQVKLLPNDYPVSGFFRSKDNLIAFKDNLLPKSSTDALIEKMGGWTKSGNVSIEAQQEYLKRVLTHEVQHAIQHREGFAAGANYLKGTDLATSFDKAVEEQFSQVQPILAKAKEVGFPNLTPEEQLALIKTRKILETHVAFRKSAEELGKLNYMRTAGEVEARNVEKRLTNKDITSIPTKGEAYHPEDQIVSRQSQTYDPYSLDGLGKDVDPNLKVVWRDEPKGPANDNTPIPAPLDIAERSWQNYIKDVKPEDVPHQEAMWGGAEQYAKAEGIPIHEAFSELVNDMWLRQGYTKQRFTPELAKRFMKVERAKLQGIKAVD